MQPYFLPYIGYFQLLASVDKFVIFDDVNFINRGWINRNRILVGRSPLTFTVPLQAASQNRLICDIQIADPMPWKKKFLRTVQQSYAASPCFAESYPLIEKIIGFNDQSLTNFIGNSIAVLANHLAIKTTIIPSSKKYDNASLSGEERIIDICRLEGASRYVNAIGGQGLYDANTFSRKGIELKFVHSRARTYRQGNFEHVPYLSILDVLMFNTVAEIQSMLFEVDIL